MSFDLLLRELVSSVEGASGAIFLEADGEAVGCWAEDGERLRLRAAYLAVVLQTCRAAIENLKLGPPGHLVIEYTGACFVIEQLGRGYLVALELSTSANIAEAIYRIKPAAAKLQRDIDG